MAQRDTVWLSCEGTWDGTRELEHDYVEWAVYAYSDGEIDGPTRCPICMKDYADAAYDQAVEIEARRDERARDLADDLAIERALDKARGLD